MAAIARIRQDWHTSARKFPKYATLMFALGCLFAVPDSAYMGRFILMIGQPLLIIGLYIAVRKVRNLAAQRTLAVLLILACLWSAPFLRRGGSLLIYIVTAEVALLFNAAFGYVTITLSTIIITVISPLLNPLKSFGDPDYLTSTLYVLFAGYLFMVFTQQSARLQKANRQLKGDMETIESLTLSRERGRMASEMHDSLGQQLSAIHYANEAAQNALGRLEQEGADVHDASRNNSHNANNDINGKYSKEAEEAKNRQALRSAIERSDTIAEDALIEVRQMARALNPTAFGQRLDQASVERMADSFSKTGMRMTTSVTGDTNMLSGIEQTLMFRALQETLTNAVRHAHAANVHIGITVGANSTRLTVDDDGPGMDENDVEHGFGLAALRERAMQNGGSLQVGESQALGGAKVTFIVPRDVNGKQR